MSYRLPLTTDEYRALINYKYQRGKTQGGPGWALISPEGRVAGYHWWDTEGWNTTAAAFATFVPDLSQHRHLTESGWRVEGDHDGQLLAWFLREIRGENPTDARMPGWSATVFTVTRGNSQTHN